jgi:hypothetical protein
LFWCSQLDGAFADPSLEGNSDAALSLATARLQSATNLADRPTPDRISDHRSEATGKCGEQRPGGETMGERAAQTRRQLDGAFADPSLEGNSDAALSLATARLQSATNLQKRRLVDADALICALSDP